MKKTTEKKSLPIRFAASVLLVPTALAEIPKGIKQSVEDFKTEVRNEMETRIEKVNILTTK